METPLRDAPRDMNLQGVPETMLMTLAGRAWAARHGALSDPQAIRIFESLPQNFEQRFGNAARATAARAIAFDRVLKPWIGSHPDGFVASLGEGLETQGFRLDNGRMRWLSVDLPESIAVREKFLTPSDRFRHLSRSALDFSWMDEVDRSKGVFIVVQGLLMYFTAEDVQGLFSEIARRFPQAELVFDFVPQWVSRLSRRGMGPKDYRLPEMPWGIDYDRVEPTLREWIPGLASVQVSHYRNWPGPLSWIQPLGKRIPLIRNRQLGMAHIRF